MTSGIVPQNDDSNDYVIKVNKILREALGKRNIGYLDNESKNSGCNCNRSLSDEVSDWHKCTLSKNSFCKS